MSEFEFNLLPTAVGSLPHEDPKEACELVLKHLPQIPAWPQLPKRTFRENMYAQFSEGFPGIVLEDERVYVDRGRDLDPGLERLYVAYLENDIDYGATSPDYAAGLPQLIASLAPRPSPPVAIKGQVTGPISWGLTVVDQNKRPILYDEVLADAVAKHLRLKAAWQERELRKISPKTIIFVDEPYLCAFGSAFVSLSREQVVQYLEEVFAGIAGIKGIHCCGNTDWAIVLSTSLDILNFDAYNYAESLSLYPDDVKAFLKRGGVIAWGIVPASEEVLEETVDSLVERLHWGMDLLVKKAVPFEDMINASLIMPSCGLRTLSVQAAERALELTAGVSAAMRERYSQSARSQ